MASRQKSEEKVQVNVRCRPMNQSERQRRIKKVVECNSKSKEVTIATSVSSVGLSGSHQTKSYSFDKVFGPNATQLEVYKSVVECQLQDVLAGYNCTVLAYGQTGTGKTYTMEGERSMDEVYSWDTDPRAGIIPRTLSQLFDCLEKAGCEFSVRVSLLEIYNEEIYDLLSSSSDMRKMKIYEDSNKKGSVVVSGLTEVHVRHKSDVYRILQQGATKRRTAATNLNEFSSRSHSVFSVTVHTKDVTHNNMEEEELVKIGKLNLVDLAGSENIGRSGAVDKHAREAGNINQSLLTLGRCITALVDRTPHIPYRESKLTRLLQDSLGGATKTSMIATVSPGSDNFDETMSTLEYAARAKNIHNKPRVNQKLTKRALIKEYDDEIERLRREVVAMREKNGVYVDPQKYDEMVHQIETLSTTVKQLEEEASEFKELFTTASSELECRAEELRLLQDDLLDVRKELAEQCFLKDVHIEHGHEVVKFASEVLETTAAVTNDIDQVHDKVDRVKQVHENNVNSFCSFTEGIKSDIGEMHGETISVLKETKNNVQETLGNLAAYKEHNDTVLEKLTSFIKKFRDVTRDLHQSNNTVMTEWNACLGENVDRQNNLVTMHNAAMFDHCQRSNNKLAQLDDVSDCLLEVIGKCRDLSAIHCQDMEARAHLTAEHARNIERRIENMNSSLDQLMDREKENKNAIEGMLANISDCLKKLQQQADERRDVRERTSTAIIDVTAAFERKTVKESDSRATELNQRMNEVLESLESCDKTLKTYQADQVEELEKTKEISEKCNVELGSVFDTVREDGISLVNTCEQQIERVNDSVDQWKKQCHVVVEEMRQKCVEHVDQVSENNLAMDEDLDAVRSILDEGNAKVVECVNQYTSNKLKKIVPTGMTPARKVYEYSRDIPQAPNDEEVLNNFREKLLESDSQDKDEPLLDERFDEDDESATSQTSKNESDQVADLNLDESITIPDVGGLPFFKKSSRSRAKLHPAVTKKSQSRIPLKPVHNVNNHRSDDA